MLKSGSEQTIDLFADPFFYNRKKTREVMVGKIGVGGNNPIRIQTMTISDTMDTEASVRETLQLAGAGAEIVRITTPTVREAENLGNIVRELRRLGCDVPIVADIHFQPKAAMIAVEYADKVRINPGNFVDRKKFEILEYTDSQYQEELEHVQEAFRPLVLRARELGRSLRIGTNHGSLSDRIMNRFGDTPQGMVESALEFIKIAELYDFRDIIVSMKSSNTKVMVQAYRMLVDRFARENMNYPLHLGVTEAGNGQDGRIKSAAGIGALLEDGIGDTIRVSLTEDSIHEIPVAAKIAARYNRFRGQTADQINNVPIEIISTYKKNQTPEMARRSCQIITPGIGGTEGHRVLVSYDVDSGNLEDTKQKLLELSKDGADAFVVEDRSKNLEFMSSVAKSLPSLPFFFLHASDSLTIFPDWISGYIVSVKNAKDLSEILAKIPEDKSIILLLRVTGENPALELKEILSSASGRKNIGFAMDTIQGASFTQSVRLLSSVLEEMKIHSPILLSLSSDDLIYDASIHAGGLLMDGIGDAIFFQGLSAHENFRISLDLLQAVRLRLSKTEFISCPSCGRTLFDLQSVTERIKKKTGHLKGVKIAIMGCIVNGPGEMADADFGYVGAGPGHIHLYRGKEIVKKHVPSARADGELIDLIKENGLWADP